MTVTTNQINNVEYTTHTYHLSELSTGPLSMECIMHNE